MRRFDDEQLFYLLSRGIPEPIARRLVVRGFFGEVLHQLGVESVIERATQTIEAELAKMPNRAGDKPFTRKPRNGGRKQNTLSFEASGPLFRALGVDLTEIEGIDVATAGKSKGSAYNRKSNGGDRGKKRGRDSFPLD